VVVAGHSNVIGAVHDFIEPYYTEDWNPERLKEVCFVCQPALFFRRSVVEKVGPLDARLRYCMDYEYWLRLAKHGVHVARLPWTLANTRMYESNKTVGSRTRVCREINEMMARTLGKVPDHWIITYSHAVLEARGFTYKAAPLRFAVLVSALCWISALWWNHSVSPGVRGLTRQWVVGNLAIKWSALREGLGRELARISR
jgi:hypothetical protein